VTRQLHQHTRGLLLLLYLLQFGLALALVALWANRMGLSIGAALLVVLLVSVGAARVRSAGPVALRALGLAVVTNLLSLVLLAAGLEVSMRATAEPTPEGLRIGNVLVPPSWTELVARSERVLGGREAWDYWPAAYFVFDPQLGWTVGPDRATDDGLNFSSVEGIRSARPGERLADRRARARVALVGDSNAFSSEVPFEDSWGHQLEVLLGPDVQVLNFGVDGYGIGQMLLRYERDVRPLRPDVVVVGFIGHDLERTMAVYPFVSFGWPGYLVKPRFVPVGDDVEPANLPLPTPDRILDAGSADALPFVRLDPGYVTADWTWRNERMPLLLRFLDARFPRWSPPPPELTEEAGEELNARLLLRLVGSIEADGARPVVFLLSGARDDLDRKAARTLERAGIGFFRVLECLEEVPAGDRYVPSGIHFSGAANAAVARCTAPVIAPMIGR
jgi:hypothetical protein